MNNIRKVLRRAKNSVTANYRYKVRFVYVCTENIRRFSQAPINRVKLFHNTITVVWLLAVLAYGRNRIRRWIKSPHHKPRCRIKLEMKWDKFPYCRWVRIDMGEAER